MCYLPIGITNELVKLIILPSVLDFPGGLFLHSFHRMFTYALCVSSVVYKSSILTSLNSLSEHYLG
jgi:hypothetical protein